MNPDLGGLRPSAHHPSVAAWLLALPLALLGAGCATSSSDPGLVDRALQAVGLSKPAVPDTTGIELPRLPRKVTLRLHAGEVLNTDPSGRSLAVVARIYKLREASGFLDAPYEAFRDAGPSKPLPFEQDVVEAREIVLKPGQVYEVIESLPPQAGFLAVATLFRAPAATRWRFAFPVRESLARGITMGVHGCALSVAQGQPVSAPAESLRLAGVRCE